MKPAQLVLNGLILIEVFVIAASNDEIEVFVIASGAARIEELRSCSTPKKIQTKIFNCFFDIIIRCLCAIEVLKKKRMGVHPLPLL